MPPGVLASTSTRRHALACLVSRLWYTAKARVSLSSFNIENPRHTPSLAAANPAPTHTPPNLILISGVDDH